MRRYWKLPLCPVEQIPASIKTDPLLAQAGCMAGYGGGSASDITYLRRGKNTCTLSGAEEHANMWRNNSVDTKVIAGGAGGALCSGVESPLQPVAKTMAWQAAQGGTWWNR